MKNGEEEEEKLGHFKLCEGEYSKIRLEMRRGINDDFYFARCDGSSSSDSLNIVEVSASGSKLACTTRQL